MKSKTSCFNKTIFKKNITQFWPLWGLYLCYLLIVMPVNIWLTMSQYNYYEGVDMQNRAYRAVENALEVGLLPFPIFMVSMVMALAVFSYLYTARTANMMHALPVNRLELFSTNYLSGFLFLLVPEFIVFVSSVLVCLTNGITCIQYLFYGFLYMLGMTFFAYSVAVFVMMFTGQKLAMPFYYLIINYLYVGCRYIISMVIQLLSYGVEYFWNPGRSCILSPIYYLGNNIGVRVVYESDVAQEIEMTGGYLVGIYAAAAVVFIVAAYLLYKHRNIETAGDLVCFGKMKPVFRWGVAFCVGCLGAIITTEILQSNFLGDNYGSMVVSGILYGCLGFFAAEMLLSKNFRVFTKKRVIEGAGLAVAMFALLTIFELDVFGIEGWVPEAEEVDKAFVMMDYPFDVSEEELPVLLELHRQVIEDKEINLDNVKNEGLYTYVTFRYYMKDGKYVERSYPLPIQEEYINDTSTPTGQLVEWERMPKRLITELLGRDYANNEYRYGSIDRYTVEGESDSYTMDRTEIARLIKAIEKDVYAGNYDKYYLYALQGDAYVESFYNNISMDYARTDGVYDNWDYYSCYGDYKSGIMEEAAYGMSNFITFGPECEYTIEALRDMGIIDDTWILCTYEQYEEFMN